jgi:hypothetical protein
MMYCVQLRLQQCVVQARGAGAVIPGVCEESLQQLVHAVE